MTQAPLWWHRVDRAGTVSTIMISGELDLSAEPGLREALTDELHRPGIMSLVVDMSSVSFIDSPGLSVLVRVLNIAHDADCQFTVTASRAVRRILEVTGLADLLSAGDR